MEPRSGCAINAAVEALGDHWSFEVLRNVIFGLPVIFFAAYFADLALVSRVVWITHLWAGSIFAAGVVGLALSLLIAPDRARSGSR